MDALRKFGPPLAIIVAGVAVYAGSFRVPFFCDDYDAIVNNANIRALWPIATAMTPPQQSTLSSRPVASLSLAVNYAVSGLDVWSYHAFNLLLHLLNGLLLFAIARKNRSGVTRLNNIRGTTVRWPGWETLWRGSGASRRRFPISRQPLRFSRAICSRIATSAGHAAGSAGSRRPSNI